MSHRNLLLLLSTTMFSYACFIRAEQNPYARYVAAAYSWIDRWSLEDVPPQDLFEGAMFGMVAKLNFAGDEHSTFVPEHKYKTVREDLSQQFGGVGIRLKILGMPPAPTVLGAPVPESPAAAAGLHSGDRIVAIDGQPTTGVPIEDVLQRVRGVVGEPITFSVIRPGEQEPSEVRLVRSIITEESIYGDVRDDAGHWIYHLPEQPEIGYLRIVKFGDRTLDEFTHLLGQLRDEQVKALIIDVRDDGGGVLDAAVGICDLFLRAGSPIVSTRDREGIVRDRYVSTGGGGFTDVPIAVLINGESASASEILAACLQDEGRAVVVGERSYGKGTVQQQIKVESGRSLLKLTSWTYWRPSGKNIHRHSNDTPEDDWGVRPTPGFEVNLSREAEHEWRENRYRRDLLGKEPDPALADFLEVASGEPPADYNDEALDLAEEYLESVLKETQ